MAVQIKTADYAGLNDAINQYLNSGKFTATTMSVYSDASATNLVTDDNGPIENRQIASVTVVYDYVDPVTEQNMNGYTTVQFNDGSSIVATDNVNQYWYVLAGVPYVPRTFG